MKSNILKCKIDVIFIYEYIRESDFKPLCVIFYLKNDILYRLDFISSATTLIDSGHNSISSYLDTETKFLEDNLEDLGEPAVDSDIDFINDSSDEITYEKSKLKGILRKQKIQKILK